ncbi:MAG: bifunctional phosphopantothenoylcysteine decarboxylase/phosphopantothenate--cysteine ligase CoaBC [Lachnospiraceae bacterium]|nr:bifunctional phosphopantothenoylcysteine decarboxylase/phosphopantothenate--cysteine ligase CoaBC [Lachnospiraceae bacterium]
MLKGKTIVIGVTGSIAAYKIASLCSQLVKMEADVHVLMTQNATNFINPITFETLTSNKCIVDTFDRNFSFEVEHVSLGKKADIMLIAPASANVIGKIAGGIADDMLTTTVLACKAPVYIAPTMNTTMYENGIVQDNLEKLKKFGYHIIDPSCGRLACKDVGAGKMPEPEELLQYILKEVAFEKDMAGKKVLITAGPTLEAIDPVRFISNHSTGKMGYALAKDAMLRGAEVTLVLGPSNLKPLPFVKTVHVQSAQDMADAVLEVSDNMDICVLSAAVADYTPMHVAKEKMKKSGDGAVLELKNTVDILKTLGERKIDGQILVGFCMETEDLIHRAQGKLERKNADYIVANSLRTKGAGFGTDTNVVTIIDKHMVKELPLLTKEQVAHEIFDVVLK